MLCGTHVTQTHRRNTSNNKAAASGASDDTKLWQREGLRPEKRVCCQPKWCAAEIDGLKDIEMRATMYFKKKKIKLQNGDERGARKGLKPIDQPVQ